MGIQYKAVGVTHVEQVKDEGDGVVSAFVSVTGIVDNVKDVIEPGAYAETLTKRTPKGVWGHQWNIPTARTIEAVELLPGDPNLPKTLANGEVWPEEAGALRIKMQFNLATQRGREAYADVTFFGDQQEWSIGYSVPDGGATKNAKTGNRHIKKLNLFEYSPVLFGAMSHARTASSVKDAQFARMKNSGQNIDELFAKFLEFKDAFDAEHPADESADSDDAVSDFEGDDDFLDDEDDDEEKAYGEDDEDEDEEEEDGNEDDDYEDEDEEDEEDEEEDEGKSLDPSMVRDAIKSLETLLNASGHEGKAGMDLADILNMGNAAYVEAKATEYDTVMEAVEGMTVTMEKSDVLALQGAAEAFDDAIGSGDKPAANEAAAEVLDLIEKVIKSDDESADSARAVARVVADRLESLDDSGDEKVEASEKEWIDADGREFKSYEFGTRAYGMPEEVDGDEVDGKDLQAAYVGGLDNTTLLSLDYVLKNEVVDPELKAVVRTEVAGRIRDGDMDVEEKRIVRTAAGARRFGLPIGSVIGGGGGTSKKPSGGGQTGRGGGSQRAKAEGRGAGNGKGSQKLSWTRGSGGGGTSWSSNAGVVKRSSRPNSMQRYRAYAGKNRDKHIGTFKTLKEAQDALAGLRSGKKTTPDPTRTLKNTSTRKMPTGRRAKKSTEAGEVKTVTVEVPELKDMLSLLEEVQSGDSK